MTQAFRMFTLALLLNGWAIAGFAQPPSPIRVTIQAEQDSFRIGDRIEIKIILKNTSQLPVTIYTPSGKANGGEAEQYVGIYVSDSLDHRLTRVDGSNVSRSDGRTARVPRAYPSRKPVVIEPGQQLEDFAELSRLFNLNKPGQYAVVVVQDIQVDRSDPSPVLATATSNTIHFTVTP
jgi:hypothetical protein